MRYNTNSAYMITQIHACILLSPFKYFLEINQKRSYQYYIYIYFGTSYILSSIQFVDDLLIKNLFKSAI